MADSKDTIYIDIDDEITGIIDKVRGSNSKVTALVLPKRAGVFQSIVNMKLLKRAADGANKNLVLITAEAGLLPLAGAAGIHVAKTLNSKPEIPAAPKLDDAADEAIDEAGEVTAASAGDQPVGKLAEQPPAENGVETLQLDDDELPEDAAAKPPTAKKPKDFAAAAGADKATKKGKGKGKSGSKFKIPNFGTFRKKLIFGGIILFLLILAFILGMIILPKATISVKTDATNVPVELNLNLSTTETQLDTNSDTPTVPAKLASEQKTFSQQVPTTGQKNHGNKASGSVKLTNCGSAAVTISSGSGFSASGQTYVSTQDVTVPKSSYDNTPHGFSCNNDGIASVNVQAQSGGSSSNVPGNTTFTLSNNPGSVTAQGGTSGGTDNIVQTVNQNDINNAKAKIATNDNAQKQALQNDLKSKGEFPIISTFSPGTPNVTQSAGVGDVANNVTVTEVITYTMFGAKEKDLDKLVDSAVKNQVDTSKQTILSEGLNSAVFGVNTSSSTSAQLTLQTTAEVGPDLNIAAIKQQALGKKPNDVKSQLQGNPDVTDVKVKLSPFWVSSIPKKASKVKVTIAKPTTTKSTNNASNSP